VSVHTVCLFSLQDTLRIHPTVKIHSLSTKSIHQVHLHCVCVDVGSYFPWRATAIGRNASSAKQFLEKRYNEEMELEDAIHTALLTLKEGFEGEMTQDTVEIGSFTRVLADCRHCERARAAFTWI
jgi:20S proteasome alpha/beta subunit